MSTSTVRGADIVMRTLERAGHSTIFTLSGNHIMSLFDAAIDTRHRLVHMRHEAAAVHMADAWGRLTGEPGIAMVTGGPGHANAVAALFTAQGQESPMVLLSGHTETDAAWPRRLPGAAPGRDGGAGGKGVVDRDLGCDARGGCGEGDPHRALGPAGAGASQPAVGPAGCDASARTRSCGRSRRPSRRRRCR